MAARKIQCVASISLGACLLASQAQAVSITDLGMFNTLDGFLNPSAAEQGRGKASAADIDALMAQFAGDSWSLLDETNKSSTAFHAGSFAFTADVKRNAGAWLLSWDGADLPLYMDFAIVMKGEGHWGAYLFESVNIGSDIGAANGSFQMPWKNKQGKAAKLDHASVFGRRAGRTVEPTDPVDDPTDPVDDPTDPVDEPTDANFLPIPGSLALLSLGLAVLMRPFRRQRSGGSSILSSGHDV